MVTSTWGVYFPLSEQHRGGSNLLLTPADSQITVIKNSQYAKGAYSGTACPEPHQD